MILTKKVDAYVKRDSILDENIQKAYSLMLGKCTELLKSKLKTTTDWTTVSTKFDILGLMKTIRSVIFKFEDQRYLPLSLELLILPPEQSFQSRISGEVHQPGGHGGVI